MPTKLAALLRWAAPLQWYKYHYANKKDRALLEMIKASFNGVGTITKSTKDSIKYRV